MSGNIVNDMLKNDSDFQKNGIMGNIREEVDSKIYDNLFNGVSPDTNKLLNCNTQGSLQGILEETLLSNTFFSVDNIQNIQNMIRYYFYKEKEQVISEQSNNELLTIMRGTYLKYSNSAANTTHEIISEVQELNNIVVEFSLKQIYINFDNYTKYIKDLEVLPLPLDLPKLPDKKNYTYDLSSVNDM